MSYTARQIADAMGVTPQAVRQKLQRVTPAGRTMVGGNEAAVYDICQLPVAWQSALDACAERLQRRNSESLLADPPKRQTPPIPTDKICKADVQEAGTMRDIFRPWLTRQHDPALASSQMDAAGVSDYHRLTGVKISESFFRKLFNRFVERAGVDPDWDELSIYLPVNPRPKEIQPDPIPAAMANEFEKLEYHIKNNIGNPAEPTKEECAGVWALALGKHAVFLRAGESKKSATRRVLNFLNSRAKFLAGSPDALRKAFELRLEIGIEDQRKGNGNRAKYPEEDLKRLRHSAFDKNGGRIDSAWREEYKKLSDYTRQRHPYRHKCPRTLYKAVNRLKVDLLVAAAHSEPAIRNIVGRVRRNHEGMLAMAGWSCDDVTSNVQIAWRDRFKDTSLLLPQIVVTMDNTARKILSWSMSNNKGPTSRLVCVSIKRAILDFGVPEEIGLENGWVFGGSLNINGKEDEYGQTIVAGLSTFGCVVRHFLPRSPTSKPDLENSFNILQRQMERHPGYSGRIQMLHASDGFKREERLIGKLINEGKGDQATDYRYTFEEFSRVFQGIVDEYNAAPQPYGRLGEMSPNVAFEQMRNPIPATKFNNKLQWLLDERYRVTVKGGGVNFTHYGRPMQVKGGPLTGRVGDELWALVDQMDDSLVTFMNLDYSETFTVETMPNPSPDEVRIARGSGLLAEARKRINEHVRSAKDEVKALRTEFTKRGSVRQDLLAQIRNQPGDGEAVEAGRRLLIDPQFEDAGEQLQQQRESIREQRQEIEQQERRAKKVTEDTGLNFPAEGVSNLTAAQLQKLKKRLASQPKL